MSNPIIHAGNDNLPIHDSISSSKRFHEENVRKYGRNIRIKGFGNVRITLDLLRATFNGQVQWEDRLLSTDPVSLAYVMNHTNDYQKPWQSRRVISRLIGEGEYLKR